jgi:hypothetical protein
MMMKNLGNFLKSPQGAGLLSMLTYITAIAITYLKDAKIGNYLIISVFFSLLIIIVVMLIASEALKLEIEEEYEKNNEKLKGFIETNGLGNIISEHELARLESKSKTIWVFSLDLSNDTGIKNIHKQNNEIQKIVQKNLSDGKKYIYFIPDEPTIYGAIEEYKRIYNYKEGQVKFCLIPPKKFHIVSEIVIYDEKIAVQWFPSKNMNYYIKLDKNYTKSIIETAKLILKNCNNLTLKKQLV